MVRTGPKGAFVALVGALVAIVTSCQWTLAGYDAAGTNLNTAETTLGVANVSGLHLEWTTVGLGLGASNHTPIVFDAKVFVASSSGLAAYDASGTTGCSGIPRTCLPLWTAPGVTGQPFAYGGMVYASGGGALRSFDPDGVAGCSGSPTVCTPLSTALLGINDVIPANGEIFGIGTGDFGVTGVVAFDDAALDGCGGPCAPLRTYEVSCPANAFICGPTGIAADGGELIIRSDHEQGSYHGGSVAGYDRSGVRSCSGVPATCSPLWTEEIGFGGASLSGGAAVTPWREAVEDEDNGSSTSGLRVLDQVTGATRWTGAVPTDWVGQAAVGRGLVHLGSSTQVRTYPLATACTTSCPPHHVATLTGSGLTGPKVANGVVFVGTTAGVQAFDATGSAGCTGTPIVCSPLATVLALGGAAIRSMSIALGNVWTIGSDEQLHVYGLG